MGGYFFDGSGYVAQVVDAVGAEGADLLEGAEGLVDDGALAIDEFKVETHGCEREEEVGEDDGGVDAEALGCGDGDFSGDLGGAADLEQGVMFADRHVLGHVTTGLAEEPDGGAVHGATEAGADEAAARGDFFSGGLRWDAFYRCVGQEKGLPFERSIRRLGSASGLAYGG